jgi:hypothetical protein
MFIFFRNSDYLFLQLGRTRRAAHNAVRLPKVDELVQKAGVAANRAATAARVAAIKAAHNRKEGKICFIDV